MYVHLENNSKINKSVTFKYFLDYESLIVDTFFVYNLLSKTDMHNSNISKILGKSLFVYLKWQNFYYNT